MPKSVIKSGRSNGRHVYSYRNWLGDIENEIDRECRVSQAREEIAHELRVMQRSGRSMRNGR